MAERTNEEFRLQRLHEKCFQDLTGKKFNHLTVLGVDHKRGKSYYWKCKCDCGNETVVYGGALKNGHTKSCGCAKKGCQVKDLTGQRFGMLTVIRQDKSGEDRRIRWLCKCDCGNEKVVVGSYLTSGTTKSCGCMTSKWKQKQALEHHKYKDITGQKFNHLTALHYLGHSLWDCVCDCGNPVHKEVKYSDLVRGFVQSCGCVHIAQIGSAPELEIKEFIKSIIPNVNIVKDNVLGRKEIDIYLPDYKFGIEYCGSIFHATEGGLYRDLDKYYHRDKFLLAKEKGIRLLTIFDVDYEKDKSKFLNLIKSILLNNEEHNNPNTDIVYTNNDIDDGKWLLNYGYIEDSQMEPDYYMYRDKAKIYRCGQTKWILQPNTEVTN